ncbi:Zinc transport protein ZntB [Fusarium austroafricanum]|uniref:Zinc transport protein ZntB n=1 Tax=Fusarium austroafricanum TaxID=2364996 RepID=A0A8H4KKU8_9HYPO|nr:Zinc transport protein ZntB [Fusarium austroafricanum]
MAIPSYTDFVVHQAQSNPCIWGLSQYLKKATNSTSRIIFIDLPQNQVKQVPVRPISAKAEECVELTTSIPPNVTRLVFVENITPNIINQIGKSLDIDPLFFADYITTDFRDLEKQPPPPSLAILPSLISEKPYLHLHYQRILDLGSSETFRDSDYVLHTNSNAPRNVRRLVPLSGRQLALARANCSILFKRIRSSHIGKANRGIPIRYCLTQAGLFLVDRPIDYVLEESGTKQQRTYPAKAMYSGFEDFQPAQPFSDFSSGQANQAWDKASILDSLVHYFCSEQSHCSPSILSISYYPMRVVLSEWNLYIHLTSRFSKYYEYSLRDMPARLHDDDIIDLQRWRRRCKQSRHKLALLFQYINYWEKHENDKESWILIQKDIDYLRRQLQEYGQSLEQMVTVATSMVQLLDSRRSILEAVSVRRLTYIALIFIPLAWVASLFSMSEGFLPGNEHFWVYFAVSLPLLGLVLSLSALPYEKVLQVLRSYLDKIQDTG